MKRQQTWGLALVLASTLTLGIYAHGGGLVQVGIRIPAPRVEVDVYGELSRAGSWDYNSEYHWIWRPAVAVRAYGWHPYGIHGGWCARDGRQYWVSHYAWGPYVYNCGGRWVLLRGGWCWVPPQTWAYYQCLPPPPVPRYQPVCRPSVSFHASFGSSRRCAPAPSHHGGNHHGNDYHGRGHHSNDHHRDNHQRDHHPDDDHGRNDGDHGRNEGDRGREHGAPPAPRPQPAPSRSETRGRSGGRLDALLSKHNRR